MNHWFVKLKLLKANQLIDILFRIDMDLMVLIITPFTIE